MDQPHARVEDLESGFAPSDLTDSEEIYKAASFRGLTFAQVTDQIWHFCSVDHGMRCMRRPPSIELIFMMNADVV